MKKILNSCHRFNHFLATLGVSGLTKLLQSPLQLLGTYITVPILIELLKYNPEFIHLFLGKYVRHFLEDWKLVRGIC